MASSLPVWQDLGPTSNFLPKSVDDKKGTVVDIEGEGCSVAVFYVNKKFYAIDKFCYHHGESMRPDGS